MKSLSRVQLFATPWTVAHQAPPSMGFSRQEHWSGLPFPSPGDLLDTGVEPGSPALLVDSLPSEPPGKSDPMLGGSIRFRESGPCAPQIMSWRQPPTRESTRCPCVSGAHRSVHSTIGSLITHLGSTRVCRFLSGVWSNTHLRGP